MNEKTKKRVIQVAVILLIAAVVVTYSITGKAMASVK